MGFSPTCLQDYSASHKADIGLRGLMTVGRIASVSKSKDCDQEKQNNFLTPETKTFRKYFPKLILFCLFLYGYVFISENLILNNGSISKLTID